MLKSFLVLFIFSVRFSVAQTPSDDYIEELTWIRTENPNYNWGTTPEDCGPNAVFECAYPCPPQQTCKDRTEIVSCIQEEQVCEYKCVCEPGFFRNTEDGVCISEKQCAKCPGPNEHYACGNSCDNVCSTLQIQNRTNCPNTYDHCHFSCYCDDGYARDDNGVCVPIYECPRPLPKICSGRNEEFTRCRSFCSNETCSSIASPPTCDSEELCYVGCVCKEGFFRTEINAPCIPLCECPEMKDSDECATMTTRKIFHYILKFLGL